MLLDIPKTHAATCQSDDENEDEPILPALLEPDDDSDSDVIDYNHEEVELTEIEELLISRPQNFNDDALLTFTKHTEPILSCAFHPILPIVVTGSLDHKAFVWRIDDGEVIFDNNCHEHTVSNVMFSHDGLLLATVDITGNIFVYEIKANEQNLLMFNEIWKYFLDDMCWIRWHINAHALCASCRDGDIYMWVIPSGNCQILPGFGSRCESANFSADGSMMFAAYENSYLRLWELKNQNICMYLNDDHPMSLSAEATTVACDGKNVMYAAGDSNGRILFCTKNGPVDCIDCNSSIEYLAFSPSNEMKIAAAGNINGQIMILDYESYSIRTTIDLPNKYDGITRLRFLSDYTVMVATIFGIIYGFDVRNGECKFNLTGHSEAIHDIAYNTREGQLLTVSSDNHAKIFKLPDCTD